MVFFLFFSQVINRVQRKLYPIKILSNVFLPNKVNRNLTFLIIVFTAGIYQTHTECNNNKIKLL